MFNHYTPFQILQEANEREIKLIEREVDQTFRNADESTMHTFESRLGSPARPTRPASPQRPLSAKALREHKPDYARPQVVKYYPELRPEALSPQPHIHTQPQIHSRAAPRGGQRQRITGWREDVERGQSDGRAIAAAAGTSARTGRKSGDKIHDRAVEMMQQQLLGHQQLLQEKETVMRLFSRSPTRESPGGEQKTPWRR